MDQAAYDSLLDLIYECAVDPDLWPAVLQRLGEAAGAPYAVLIRQNEATGRGDGIRWNIDPAIAEPYYGYFATRNPLHNTPDPAASIRNWRPAILTDEDKMPKGELLRTEYYNDHMRRWDFHSTMMIRVALEGMDTLTINLLRPRRREQFGPDDIAVVRRAHPHLIRSAYLGQKVGPMRRLGNSLAAWIDQAADAFFLLSADGRIEHMNGAARAVIAAGPSLTDRGGLLAAGRPGETRRLERLIAAATSADGPRTGGAMALTRLGRRRPWRLTVAPLKGGEGAVVLVSGIAGEGSREQTLRETLGLTVAEARIAAALFEGATLKDAAEAFGLSFNTVRNQLSAVFDKTATRRQSELMRLMARTARPELT